MSEYNANFSGKETGFTATFGVVDGAAGATNYNNLKNLPKLEDVEIKGEQTADDFGLAKAEDIPTKLSQLENDAGFQTEDQQAEAISEALGEFYKSLCPAIRVSEDVKTGTVLKAVSKDFILPFNYIEIANGDPTDWLRISDYQTAQVLFRAAVRAADDSVITFTSGTFQALDQDHPDTSEWHFSGVGQIEESMADWSDWYFLGNNTMAATSHRFSSKPEITWDLTFNESAASNPFTSLNNNEWTWAPMYAWIFFRVDGVTDDPAKTRKWLADNNVKIKAETSISTDNVWFEFSKITSSKDIELLFKREKGWVTDTESVAVIDEYRADPVEMLKHVS